MNPERPWPSLERLRGDHRRVRLRADGPADRAPGVRRARRALARPADLGARGGAGAEDDGLARPGVRPTGLPWQEPDGGFASVGRTDLFEAVDTEGRTDDRRSDFSDVYGDWESVQEAADGIVRDERTVETLVPQAQRSRTIPTEGLLALAAAERDPGNLSDEHALTLMTAEGPLLEQVCRLADDLRRETVGDEVTYVVNRNINFTNVCYVGCRFCAFAQRRTDADAYSLSLDEVADRAHEAWELGATEVCMQGGIDPELPATAYFDLVTAVRQRVPEMHVHAFSPMEVVNGTARTGLSIEDFLIKAREAGLGSLPGTAAEILDDEVRWVLTKGKLPTRTWIEVVTTAHRLGHPHHLDDDVRPRRQPPALGQPPPRPQQDPGGDLAGRQGFTEFVPLPFVHTSSPIYLAGVARPGPTLRDNLAVHALARILLHGRIPNIQTSWVKLGVDGTRAMLRAGANDLGGTLMEETISRMAGSEHGSAKTVEELVEIGAGSGGPWSSAPRCTAAADPTEASGDPGQGTQLSCAPPGGARWRRPRLRSAAPRR